MIFDRDDSFVACTEHDGAHSVYRDADGPEPCDEERTQEPTPEPGELLNHLETADGPLTVAQLVALTGFSGQAVEDDLLRLEDKGLARPVRNEDGAAWTDLLRFVPPVRTSAA